MTRKPTPDILTDILDRAPAASVVLVPLDDIDDNPWQPRQTYDPAALEELAASIETNGLQQPPAGRRTAGGRIQLTFGHRRKRAYDLLRAKHGAGYDHMPVMIVAASDEDMAARAWAENVERRDLTAVEQAQAIQAMIDAFGWSQADIARRLGLAPATVSNKLRLLRAPAEVRDAVASGQISERQAGALAPVWDLPAPALQTARNHKGHGSVANLIARAHTGASSDELRQNARNVVITQTFDLDKSWYREDLAHVAGVSAARCTDCQYRILLDGKPRCAGQRTCYDAKDDAWNSQQCAGLAEAAGVPVLPVSTSYSAYDTFYGERRALAQQGGLHRPPLCGRLRIRPTTYTDGLRVDGLDNADLVCLNNGQGCACLKRITAEIKADGRAQWKLLRQQTLDALTAALLAPTQNTIRLWATAHAPWDQKDQVVNWRIEDAVSAIAKGLIDHAKPYDVETKPDEARLAMEALLHRGGIPAPWSLAAALAPEPSLADQLNGRAHSLESWITSATDDTPAAPELEQRIDASRQAIGQLDQLPAGDQRDDLLQRLDAANQSLLEMLDLVQSGYRISKTVRSLCHTPITDINGRGALERAAVDDLRWSLAVARCQPDGKTRLRAVQSRLRRLMTAR